MELRLAGTRAFWGPWVAIGVGFLVLGVVLAVDLCAQAQSIGGVLGALSVSLVYAALGAVAFRTGLGGWRSCVVLTAAGVTLKNTWRMHVLTWPEVVAFEVGCSGYAGNRAAVRTKARRRINISASNLTGFDWNEGRRAQAVIGFIAILENARNAHHTSTPQL